MTPPLSIWARPLLTPKVPTLEPSVRPEADPPVRGTTWAPLASALPTMMGCSEDMAGTDEGWKGWVEWRCDARIYARGVAKEQKRRMRFPRTEPSHVRAGGGADRADRRSRRAATM